jgi:hypothetical protein
MKEDQTQRLITALANDREPVRLLPRLRTSAGAVLALSSAVLVYSIVVHGVRADWAGLMSGSASYAAILLGLAVCGLGATLAAIAGATPGREDVMWRGGLLAAIGLSSGVLVASLGAALGAGWAGSLGEDWMCLRSALLLSPLPAAAGLFVVSRGFVARPGLVAAAALVGAAATGAIAIHLACDLTSERHFLLGHASAPILLALALSVPAAVLLRRFAR